MSWASHDLEPYVIQRVMGRRVIFVPVLLGSYIPDLCTKWVVYGTHIFGYRVGVGDPARFHRGWPGAGFTHSPFFGLFLALLVIATTGNKLWAFSLMIGQWAHAFTDVTDTLGTMLLFPFSTHIFSIGLWKYAAEAGRLGDASAYFSGPAVVWDCLWVILVVLSWRVLTRDYFRTVIAPNDKFWAWAGRRAPESVLLALYRTSAFYGALRLMAWLIWVHLVTSHAFDISWGGPHWIKGINNNELNGGGTSTGLLISAIVVTLICAAVYWRGGHGPLMEGSRRRRAAQVEQRGE